MPLFGKKKVEKKTRQPPQQQHQQQHHGPRANQSALLEPASHRHSHSSSSLDQEHTSPSPSGELLAPQTSGNIQGAHADGEVILRYPVSSGSVKKAVKKYEQQSLQRSPEKRSTSSKSSTSSPEKISKVDSGRFFATSSMETQASSHSYLRRSSSGTSQGLHSSVIKDTNTASVLGYFSEETLRLEVGKEKVYEGVDLRLPPLQTSSVRHRTVVAVKNTMLGGFGFVLRKSFQPDPENQDKPLLVHLIEPRPNYVGPLMTGDRIIEVNGENVENVHHERVVEMIKASGDSVAMVVASVPELMELNVRGALDEEATCHHSHLTSSGTGSRKKTKQGAGTLRKKGAQRRTFGYYQV